MRFALHDLLSAFRACAVHLFDGCSRVYSIASRRPTCKTLFFTHPLSHACIACADSGVKHGQSMRNSSVKKLTVGASECRCLRTSRHAINQVNRFRCICKRIMLLISLLVIFSMVWLLCRAASRPPQGEVVGASLRFMALLSLFLHPRALSATLRAHPAPISYLLVQIALSTSSRRSSDRTGP